MQKLKGIEAQLHASPDPQISLTDPDARSACEQTGITTSVPKPLTSSSKAEGRFGKQALIYMAASDEYRCPEGQLLTRRHSSVEDSILHCYWFSGCQRCSMPDAMYDRQRGRLKHWEHEAVVEGVQIRVEHVPPLSVCLGCPASTWRTK